MSVRMLGLITRVALGTAAAAAVTAGAGTAPAGAAAAAHWHIVKSVKAHGSGEFTAVVATGRTSGWAFDGFSSPTAWERNGSAWTKVAFPGEKNEYVTAAGAVSPSDVWAFADTLARGSQVLRWNGHQWSVVHTFTSSIRGASVLAGNDVWVFGDGAAGLGVWHYDGHAWTQVSKNLSGGSALSAIDAWAYTGTNVDHWNGHAWTSTSVKKLLPARQSLNHPAVGGILALSADNVYAVGNSNTQDEGGPVVVLHFDGHTWTKVAEGDFTSYGPGQQFSTDGNGGLWLPMPGASGAASSMVHFTAGQLTRVRLPVSGEHIVSGWVANIPGTTQMLAGGLTFNRHKPSTSAAVVLQYS